MSETNGVTKEQAEAAVAAIVETFNPEIDGERYYASAPILVMDWVGDDTMEPTPTVFWEDGPSDWAHHLDGSPSEEDYSLFAQASAEFGRVVKPPRRKPVQFPKGIGAEAYYSFAICLFPTGR